MATQGHLDPTRMQAPIGPLHTNAEADLYSQRGRGPDEEPVELRWLCSSSERDNQKQLPVMPQAPVSRFRAPHACYLRDDVILLTL